MVAQVLNGGVSSVALLAIHGYRKWISPYKGFRCAHHVLHERGSCSTFGLEVFGNNTPLKAFRLLRGRFIECRDAYETLRHESADEREERKRKKSEASKEKYNDYCMPVETCPPMDCAAIDLTPDTKACDAVSCEVGTCDIGSCS
ncbi:MAG: membrane protein insertion efficiency factor YidD [Candidatus Pacebacteria bacterium]|nr:membrane protein insertion efficiency factor YidD [Candidatus Paceibacterota bacterium]